MPVIKADDILEGERALTTWAQQARDEASQNTALEHRLEIAPRLDRRSMAMAVRYPSICWNCVLLGQA